MVLTKRNPLYVVTYFFMSLMSVASVTPFILLFVASFTDEVALIQNGYSFFPEKYSISAYEYLSTHINLLARSFGVSVVSTVAGSAVGLIITAMLAYSLSRKTLPLRNLFAFLVFFTMLFNGGLVPTYIMYTRYLGIKDTIMSLILPRLLLNGFNVLIMRTYYSNSIPEEILESARIDGLGEFGIFRKIVLPISVPLTATILTFISVAYWNDWYNGLIYLTDYRQFSIQVLLNRMITDIQFLSTNSTGVGDAGLKDLPQTSVRMAIAVIGILPILCAYPFIQKYFVEGIAVGAVKG